MTHRHTHTDRERESVGQKVSMVCRSYPFHSSIPPFINPLTIPSVRSVMLRPLCALAFVWVRPESGGHGQKNAACHGERAKVLTLWTAVGGWRGGLVSGLERHCKSCGYPLLFLGSLLIRHQPHPSLRSPISFSMSVHFFPGPLSFSGARDGNVKTGETQQMSDMKLFIGMAATSLVVYHAVRSSSCGAGCSYPAGGAGASGEGANFRAVQCYCPSPFLQSAGTLRVASSGG